MSPGDRDLKTVIAEAQRESEKKAQALAAQPAHDEPRPPTPHRALALLLLNLALVAGLVWLQLRDRPDEAAMAQGRRELLRLAGAALQAEWGLKGQPPQTLETLLPVASSVRIEARPDGVWLTLEGPDGRQQELRVQAPAAASGG